MKFTIEIKEEASKDIIEAVHWYAGKGPGLNFYFIEQLEAVIEIILANPKTYKRIYKNSGKPHLTNFRTLLCMNMKLKPLLFTVFFMLNNIPKKRYKG